MVKRKSSVFAPPPDGLGVVADLEQEIAYAGSGALHAKAVANGLADSLELLDTDSGVRAVADRIFSEDCFSKVRGNLRTSDPNGRSEPMVLSRLEAGAFGPDHVLHLDPFAFIMAPEDEPIRALYRDVWMIQGRQDLRFAFEAGDAIAIPRAPLGQRFQGDIALQARVVSAADLAMPPSPSFAMTS